MRPSRGLGLLALVGAGACTSATDGSNPKVAVNTVSCVQSTQDATSVSYTVSVTGFAQGPVGTVLRPEAGLGTGAADANRTIESIDQSVFSGWSFGSGPDEITRANGDISSTSVSLDVTVKKTKPVSAPPGVYARFRLTVPSSSALDAERTATCQ